MSRPMNMPPVVFSDPPAVTSSYNPNMSYIREDVEFILCNPNGEQLYSLKSAINKTLSMRFNAISEISFTVPKFIDGEELEIYDWVKEKRVVLIEDTGYFIITKAPETAENGNAIKKVTALSYESTLIGKRIFAINGTMRIWDSLDPTEDSVFKTVLEYAPGWSLGTIDAEIITKFRTFDEENVNIYDFLTNTVAEAFNCIVQFNPLEKTISARLQEETTEEEISDEIVTKLGVYGDGGLSISSVNPLGTDYMYNFSHYMSTDWMSQGLIDSIIAWEAQIASIQASYASALTDIKVANGELIVLEGELSTLNSELVALETIMKVRIEGGETDLSAERQDTLDKTSEIDAKTVEITNKEVQLESLRANLVTMNDGVSFETNFTEDELEELEYYIYENSYSNKNFAQLNSMTPVDIQDLAQELYEQGVDVLAKLSVPRYEFEISMINMLALKEYEVFNADVQLGSIVHLQNFNGDDISLVILEIVDSYSNPNDFSLILSNRLRLDGAAFIYTDLIGKMSKAGDAVDSNGYKWSDWIDNSRDDVNSFINSSLDASKNKIINAENQEILIDSNGLRGRKWDEVGEDYEDTQVWLTSSTLGFTGDSWNSAGLALGRISLNGDEYFGLVASAVVGRIIAGASLEISNENNSFTVDGTGATLHNADLTLTTDNNANKITIAPDVGIKIETNDGGTWEDSFFVDSSGNLIFSGSLSGASGDFSGSITSESGYIGGMGITTDGIDVDSTHFIHNDGEIKWGGLWLKANGDTQISGDIVATSFTGQIDWNNIVNTPIPASQFNGGSGYSANGFNQGAMSGSRISGGTIGGNGSSIGLDSFGNLVLRSDSYTSIYGSSARLTVGGGFTDVASGQFTSRGLAWFNSGIAITGGGIYANGWTGETTYVYYKTSGGDNKYMRFQNGLLVDHTS